MVESRYSKKANRELTHRQHRRGHRYNRHQRAVWELINICRDLDLGVSPKAPIPSDLPTTKRGDLLVLGLLRAPLVIDVTTITPFERADLDETVRSNKRNRQGDIIPNRSSVSKKIKSRAKAKLTKYSVECLSAHYAFSACVISTMGGHVLMADSGEDFITPLAKRLAARTVMTSDDPPPVRQGHLAAHHGRRPLGHRRGRPTRPGPRLRGQCS